MSQQLLPAHVGFSWKETFSKKLKKIGFRRTATQKKGTNGTFLYLHPIFIAFRPVSVVMVIQAKPKSKVYFLASDLITQKKTKN